MRHLSLSWVKRGLWPFSTAVQAKKILRSATAFFPAGELSAVCGPSGAGACRSPASPADALQADPVHRLRVPAGKSTLLQLIAHRQMRAGALSSFKTDGGALLFNGEPATRDVLNSIAFVEQDDDYHLAGLTVRETLRYAALLRLPTLMTRKRKLARAEEVLLMLGLNDCANVLVGGALVKGASRLPLRLWPSA